MVAEFNVEAIIDAISNKIDSNDFYKLVEYSLFCDPFDGALDNRLFFPLKERVLPSNHYYEYIFTISEDIDLFDIHAHALSLGFVSYITILYLHCEQNHDWNQFLSGYVLAIFLKKILSEKQTHSSIAKFLYAYVENLYNFESLCTENLLDFSKHDEILVLVMHHYALVINRPKSCLTDLNWGCPR